MRIESVNLIAYGPFAGAFLDFEASERDFHIIYGPNEAGKSSLLRAITAALFGIPEGTEDNFRRHAEPRIGMTLRRKDGLPLPFQRKKGRKRTLLDEEGNPLEESALSAFWSPIEKSHFSNLFGLDHPRLIEGGKDIIAGGGEIGQSLFEAGSGLVGLPKLLLELEEETAEIFLPQGKKPALNQALERYAGAKKEMRSFSLKNEEWHQLQAALAEAAAALRKKGTELKEARRALSQLERVQRNLPALARRSSLLEKQAALGATPDLPESAGSERMKAEQSKRAAEEEFREIGERIKALAAESSTIRVRTDLLAHAGRIDSLYKNIGSFGDAARDIPKREAERSAALSEAQNALAEIRPGLPLSEAHTLRLAPPQIIAIRRLIREYSELQPALKSGRERVEEVRASIDQLRQARGHASKRIDLSGLAAAVATVKSQGDLERQLRQALQEGEAEKNSIRMALSALPLWSGGIDDFEPIALPSEMTVDRFNARFEQIEKESLLIGGQAGQERRKLQERTAELERLQAGSAVPSPAQLQEARVKRAFGWRLIREVFIEKTKTAEEADPVLDPRLPLPESYERSVAEADRIADLLYADSDRVAQHENLKRQIRRHEKEIDLLQERLKTVESSRREAVNEWEAQWRPAGISPLPPVEMRGWLQRRQRILDRIQNLRKKEGEALLLQRTLADARAALAGALEAMEQRPGGNEGLRALLLRCEQLAEKIADENAAIDALAEKRAGQEALLRSAQARLQGTEAALAAWQKTWEAAIQPLGPGAAASPLQVGGLLDGLDAVFKALKEVGEFNHRLLGMKKTVEEYTHRVSSLVEAVAPDLRGKDPDEAIEALHGLYQTAKKEEQRLENLSGQIQIQTDLLERARKKIADAERALSDLCREAGCDTVEALPSIERKAAEKRDVAQSLKALETQLIDQNALSLEEILKEAAGSDRDALPARIADLKKAEGKLQEEQLALAKREAEAEAAAKAIDGGERAAAASEQAQSALAEIRNGAEAYVRLRLSSVLLRRAIERYRERNQGPLLSRAGTFFSALTLGRFSGLKSDYDERDRPILVGVRTDGERVPIGGMSDGTADQLYLSLRLAAIEHHTEASEPCFLILDDILIQFDDDRARAALKILAELSAKTQILFFTHHDHLVNLARQTLSLPLQAFHHLERRAAKV